MWIYRGAILRLVLLMYYGIAITACFQFTRTSAVGLIVLASLSLGVVCVGTLAFGVMKLWKKEKTFLLTDSNMRLKYGSLFGAYNYSNRYFFICVFLNKMMAGVFISCLAGHAAWQIGLLFANHVVLLVLIIALVPYKNKFYTRVYLAVAVLRTITVGCSVGFILDVGLSESQRDSLAYFCLFLHLVAIVCFMALLLYSMARSGRAIYKQCGKKSDRRATRSKTSSSVGLDEYSTI